MTESQNAAARAALERAKSQYGSWRAFAGALAQRASRSLSAQGAHQWLTNGVPPYWAALIEEATGGGVTRAELRPDLYS